MPISEANLEDNALKVSGSKASISIGSLNDYVDHSPPAANRDNYFGFSHRRKINKFIIH